MSRHIAANSLLQEFRSLNKSCKQGFSLSLSLSLSLCNNYSKCFSTPRTTVPKALRVRKSGLAWDPRLSFSGLQRPSVPSTAVGLHEVLLEGGELRDHLLQSIIRVVMRSLAHSKAFPPSLN